MADTDDSSSLFNHIAGDMKAMGPLLEDLYIKASKFYGCVKQSAITADAFLDSFQKIADATTTSKGSTRDIGVLFTKMVLRHKAIELKFKFFVGILADNFLTPLQEAIDEWKKTSSALEKDHTKDYKRLKGELKKANADVAKLKKKASKKFGKQEYTDQFRESMKIANGLSQTLENQEKNYLRKLMVEERSRAAQFFHFYQPVVEQELALISEIEQLQSLLEDTIEQCKQPTKLPEAAEDLINDYKIPDQLKPGNREMGVSPPSSPMIVKDRLLSNNSKVPLTRSHTLPSNYTKPGLEPKPVSVPVMSGSNSIASSRSSFSSSSSIDQSNNIPVYDPVTLEEITASNGHRSRESLEQIDEYMTNLNTEDEAAPNIDKSLKSRKSWSSETTDSSGIGSHNSLNSHMRSSHSSTSTLPYNYCHSNSSNESEGIEPDFPDNDLVNAFYPPPPPMTDLHMPAKYGGDIAQKYATVDRSHFQRNQRLACSLREQNMSSGTKQRSNSFGENESFPDYKMNLPKNKMNTICARTAFSNASAPNGRPPVFNLFDNQMAAELRKKLSPATSPTKSQPPPTPRRNSTPSRYGSLKIAPKPKSPHQQLSHHPIRPEPRAYTEDNEPDAITPGSFQDALNQRRLTIRKKSMSIQHEASSYI